MAKSIVITEKAEQWGRDNGVGELMDELRKFQAAYQASWKLRQKRRTTEKLVNAAQARVARALAELKAEEAKLLEGIHRG